MAWSGSSPAGTGVSVTITVDSRQFSRDAALKAAYWFTKELYIEFLPSPSEHCFDVILRSKSEVPTLEDPSPRSLDELASEFRNALIDAQLRVQVQRETSAIRELLLAKAFAESGVLENKPPGSFDDPVSAVANTASDLVVIRGSARIEPEDLK